MNYEETLKYISGVPKFSKNLGNDELVRLLAYLGEPQNSLKYIHIAGTNGKGSTAAMTASILKAAGYKTGLYISPFINIFNERIQINGEYIPDDELTRLAEKVRTAIEKLKIEISEFAQITAMAFLYFAKEKCDYVVLETGLGGRLDATNVIKAPEVCIITKIGLDHTEYLGDTIEKITREKCGIIKNNAPVVTCQNQEPEALEIIEKYAEAKLVKAEPNTKYELSLSGGYQKFNAGCAIAAVRLLNIPESAIEYGLKNTRFPARFEFIRDKLLIDGAHNPDGAAALSEALRAIGKPVTLVTAMMEDKDCPSVCRIFSEIADKIIVTELDIPRCIKADKLAKLYKHSECYIKPEPTDAVNFALSTGNTVCVCGSLYLAADIRKNFKDNR